MNKKLVCLLLALMMLMCMSMAGLAISSSDPCPNDTQYGLHDMTPVEGEDCLQECACGATEYWHSYDEQTPGICTVCNTPCEHAFSGTARCVNCYYYICPHDEINSSICAQCACEIAIVTYDPGEGEGTPIVEKIVYKSDAVYQLPECTFTAPNGADFLGWDVDGETHKAGSYVSMEDAMIITAVWDIPAYEVWYYDSVDDSWYKFEHTGSHTVLSPSDMDMAVPEGKVFDCWLMMLDDEIIDFVYPGGELRGDTSWDLMPNWVDEDVQEYTVTIDMGDGQIKAYDEATDSMVWKNTFAYTMKEGSYDMLPPEGAVTAPDGYELKHFLVNGTDKYDYSDVYQVTGTTSVVAVWQLIGTVNTYTVTFDGNGATSGTMEPQTFTEGVAQALTKNAFVREGAEFLGWLLDPEDFSDGYNDGQEIEVEDDMTLYAFWLQTLTFDPNNGVDEAELLQFPQGYVIDGWGTPSDNDFSDKEGYTFTGWSDGTKIYGAEDTYTVTGNATLTAQWEPKICKVTFDLNGVEGSYPVQEVEYGSEYTLPEPDAIVEVPENLNFKGWKIGENTYGPNQKITVTEDITAVAQWSERLVSITYLNDDGEEIKVVGDLAYGTEHEELTPEAVGLTVPDSYVFDYWQVLNTRLEVIDTAYVGDDEPLVLYSNWLMKAVWKDKTYTVNFKTDMSGEDMTAMEAVSVKHGEQYVLPECTMGTPSEMWKFSHWDYMGTEYAPGDKLPAAENDMDVYARWTEKTYTIVYEDGNGTVLGTESGIVHGSVLSVKDAVSDFGLTAPDGYRFNCWIATDENGTIVGEAYTNSEWKFPVLGNYTLTPNWVATDETKVYTMTFDMNGGEPLDPISVTQGAYFELPPLQIIEHPDGLEFDYFDIGDGKKYAPHDLFLASGDVTAVAHWKNAYTITFAANGGVGEMASVTVKEGGEYTLPECTFTKDLMRFKAWSYQGQEYAPGQKITVTQNDTVTALWQQVCVVSFEANGGEGEMASVTVDMGSTYVLPECGFTRTGHTFAGWTYEENLQPGASITVNTDMKILAVWDRNPCVLTFDPGEGTGEVKTYDMLYGDGVELRDPSVHGFSYEGHECTGWTDGTNTYALGTLLDVEKDVTYTALWKKLSYTITFEGEQGSMDSVTKEYGDTYVLPECGFDEPENNEFKAWDVNGTEYQVGDSITVTSDVTVKPVWQWIECTVTFDAQGGTGTMEPVTVLAGAKFTVPVCTFGAPEFKLFSVWAVEDERVGGRYKAGDVITVYNDITLMAGWMNSELKITYKSSAADDAEIYEDPIVGGSAYTLMNNMFTAPEGKMFRCWLFPVPPTFTETEELDPGTPFSKVGSNLTFIADWEPLKYIVSFDGNGGSGSMEAAVVEHGGEFTIPACGFGAPTGMVFNGWKIDGEDKKPGDSLIITDGVTLTAQWAPMELAVSFDPGDRGGDSKTQTQLYGVAFNLPYLSDLGWDDYLSGSVFLGWNLNGEYLAEGAAFTATADTTLTAMWADRYYTITIKDSNESAAPKSVTVEYGDSYTLEKPSAYGFTPKDSRIHVFENWMRTSDQKTYAPGATISGITRSMAFEAKWTFGTIVEVEDEETGEVVETVVEIEVTTQPEEIDQNDSSVMNTSDPSKLPQQLGNMLAALQENTAGANEVEGGVVIKTMQDVVDALHESINGTVTAETEELEYPVENIAVTDIIPVLEIEIDGVVEKIEITDKSLMPDDTGIEVALEIPAGTDPATHEYKITHMLTQDAWDGSSKKAGEIETLTVHRYDEKYLYVMMKNFSPVAIAWKELPAEVIIPDIVIEELPETGDPSSLLAWVTLLGASGIGLHAMKRRKK